ncbi:galactokinase [uncultured Desulfosarcina sp.]|uniref:GHMP family kinase ATP-binding protein n=1 Tax=uncultured Desulfosarcina sp. TaxID=218289 RepID=UPI0029C87ED4|nr:galactokinase [uncultured Desulfosarcina sp.]
MKLGNLAPILDSQPITASAPCRVDFGGTLDIGSFHYPLRHQKPATVNLALDLRTEVRVQASSDRRIRIASAGFDDAVFDPGTAPYNHPLGLMFAVADYFGIEGAHIHIRSASPPRSGLGGSSVAAVALIRALSMVWEKMGGEEMSRERMALLAHAVEQGVAGVPCGLQDQLAAAFGGVNTWTWTADPEHLPFARQPLVTGQDLERLNRRLLVAYLGVTHVSTDVNGTWIRQFIGGKHRARWEEIVDLTRTFADAIQRLDMDAAVEAMNRETAIRKTMTPEVLDDLGDLLVTAAVQCGCGARFTGAGGGGCLWALGEPDSLAKLKPEWERLLDRRSSAGILDCRVDGEGVR